MQTINKLCPNQSIEREVLTGADFIFAIKTRYRHRPYREVIQNTLCQPCVSTNHPPATGPAARATPPSAAQIPIAFALAAGSSYMPRMTARDTGMTTEPGAPKRAANQ